MRRDHNRQRRLSRKSYRLFRPLQRRRRLLPSRFLFNRQPVRGLVGANVWVRSVCPVTALSWMSFRTWARRQVDCLQSPIGSTAVLQACGRRFVLARVALQSRTAVELVCSTLPIHSVGSIASLDSVSVSEWRTHESRKRRGAQKA